MKYYSVKISTHEIMQGPLDTPWEVNPLTEVIVTTDDDGGGLSDRAYYSAFRRRQYPPIGDQLDAILKAGADVALLKETIVAIKTQLPKP